MKRVRWHPDTCGCQIDLLLDEAGEPVGEARSLPRLPPRRCVHHHQTAVLDIVEENRTWGLVVLPALRDLFGLSEEEIRDYPKAYDPPETPHGPRALRVVLPSSRRMRGTASSVAMALDHAFQRAKVPIHVADPEA